MIYFTKKIQRYLSMLLKRIHKEEKLCQCHWKNYIFEQKWSNSPIFHVQLLYQDAKIEN